MSQQNVALKKDSAGSNDLFLTSHPLAVVLLYLFIARHFQKRIRENLREATRHGDIEELEKAMEIFVNNRLEDGGDYADAEDRLDFLLMRKGTHVRTDDCKHKYLGDLGFSDYSLTMNCDISNVSRKTRWGGIEGG